MPFVSVAAKLVYFAHVPRCGGSAVENYLRARFGSLALLDRQYLQIPVAQRWNNSSPQHIEVAALDRLLPPALFAARFAVVRHPVDRLVSVFRYNRDLSGGITAETSFRDWLDSLEDRRAAEPHYLDNHPRPMTELVPEDARIFRLEDGFDALIAWFDALAGDTRGPREIAQTNGYMQRLEAKQQPAGPEVCVTDECTARITALYERDLRRFGYSMPAQGTAGMERDAQ